MYKQANNNLVVERGLKVQPHFIEVKGNGSLSQTYCYKACLTAGSGSDTFMFYDTGCPARAGPSAAASDRYLTGQSGQSPGSASNRNCVSKEICVAFLTSILLFIMTNLGFFRLEHGFERISRTIQWQVQFFIVCIYIAHVVDGQVRYSVAEEMVKGSFVGNIANDLGLDRKRLISGSARIVAEDSNQYVHLDVDKGILVVNERIDRELLCGEISLCSFGFEVVLEKPLQLYTVTVEIQDVNDNAPIFPKNEITLEISESAVTGARFLLERAMDPDVGTNALQSYSLDPKDNFELKLPSRPGESKYVEMVLQTPLDREKQPQHSLILTAVDGGNPQRSGTVNIFIIVLDANDNAPVFSQSVYKAAVLESALKGTSVITVNATDADKGSNGDVTYSFTHISDSIAKLFKLDANTGAIKVEGQIDYEKAKLYEASIQAKDHGGLIDSSKVLIEIIDVNDNAPIISLTSFSSPIPEDSSPGTVIALINVQDLDSGSNGQVRCLINQHLPFNIKSSLRNYYSLTTDRVLDREKVSEYNITITATDEGSPPLSSNTTIMLKISDVNDNPPVFDKQVYAAKVTENNSPGLSILTVQASDSDWNQNARISYVLEETRINGTPISSYISINSDSGILYAARSFDYEQIREFEIHVKAQDGGSPPFSSNVTVNIIVQDQNDNAPQILYPVQTEGSLVAEMVLRSADVGYLVTKVVAVDADSGQNAWLSYQLHKATDRTLFEVGLQNGEIRTLRQVVDKDVVKQRLVVLVEDNGQPSRSATVNVNVAVADSFPEVLSEFSDVTQDNDYNENLTFYLVVSLATVSFLFIVSIIILLSVKFCKWRQSRMFYKSNGNLTVIPSSYYPPRCADAGGTLQHVYNYEVCLTTDSGKSEFKYIRPCSQSLVNVDPIGTETMPLGQKENNLKEDTDPSIQVSHCSQRPEEAGPWPNPPTEAEQLQALMAAANEVSAATATLDAGTMGLSTRYSPQFTLQHVPDYRQNVYIPGSTSTLTGSNSQAEGKNPQPSSGNKKKSGKKEKK
ncbi:Protocadherin gamma-A11 [Acipenser ruthenus]|uniref:Protocadherin gamma-A11 n=1 Tax=Acipenser ruthenus TaxID=7906 RepID=A0A444UF53_ACIRT|nr:Protocadherin gamma-A11 [Acipenser ruthenus]